MITQSSSGLLVLLSVGLSLILRNYSVSALSCGVCDPELCSPDPKDCPGGFTKGICNCCNVCAKLVNESCGGNFGLLGKCADNLRCYISPKVGQAITGQEEGICKEISTGIKNAVEPETAALNATKILVPSPISNTTTPVPPSNFIDTIPANSVPDKNCTSSNCDNDVTVICPPDSKLIQNSTSLDKRIKCQCRPAYCNQTLCAPGFYAAVLNKGKGIPGSCCDELVCKRSAVCKSVICPAIEAKICPDDSFQLPNILTEDGCCYIQQGCKCKTIDTCPAVTCHEGYQIQVISKASRLPGSCCDKFQCVNDTGLTCYYEGEDYKDGQSWQLDKCTTCTCKDGLTFCKTKTCNETLCGWMVIPDGECCPVCRGCVSESGQLYNNTEVWKENSCVSCHCDMGQVLCQAEMCAVQCSYPRQVAGQCCPVCDDDSLIYPPKLCTETENCSLDCPHGLQKTDKGCFLCKCKEEICNIKCKFGKKVNEKREEICECVELLEHCPGMDGCNKQCTYGFRKNRNGCLKCRCKSCPPFNCTKRCLHGYTFNDQGCQLCKCSEAPPLPTLPSYFNLSRPGEEGKSCMSQTGQRHEDGESWHDGCGLCYCLSGQEMCSLISCPVPKCANPVFRIGDCCPSCPGVSVLPSVGKKESCQSVSGHYFVEGEIWKMDECTQCICHDGTVLCESHTCPPVLCHHPVKPASHCCAVCRDVDGDPIIPVLTPRPCKTQSGMIHKHEAVWQKTPCQSCVCKHGQIHCYSQTCPILDCNKTFLRKGQCCPSCLDVNQYEVCRANDIAYSSGEQWLSDNCTECSCTNGKLACIPLPCTPLDCTVMIRKPGQCCPSCLEDIHSTPGILDLFPVLTTRPSPTTTLAMDGPTEDLVSKEKYVLTISALVGILLIALLALLVLFLVIMRRRHTGKFKMKHDSTIMTDIKIRPKSTNLDYQGQMPFLMDSPSKSNKENYVLEKSYRSLSPVISPEKVRLTEKTENHYVDTDQFVAPNEKCISNKTFNQV
ncbi:hypothetical protein SNE40_009225 [Patella caerulea]|uniref:Cysteine-rich motor neuron 1 protein n=1 Tax=Patella caerulea TaxID=87958 RepID=A0AAN8JUP0_PATCE